MRIGIDLMGSDSSPLLLFEAVQEAAKQIAERAAERLRSQFSKIKFIVFLTQAVYDVILSSPLSFSSPHSSDIEFRLVSDVIEMEDEPLVAIRQKKNSSLVLGLKHLKKRELAAFVTAGNTGALIAGVTLSLRRLPGIKRPALLAVLPTKKGQVAVVDVGGNVSCKANHLVQFANLGVAYQHSLGVKHPRVGLLNIGIESKKGTSELRQAYQLMEAMKQRGEIDFIGNVEGGEVFQGVVDVLVTDGFTGNVFLKSSEGVSAFILHQFKEILQVVAPEHQKSILKSLQAQFDYEEYNGAIICGIDSIVVKCHGHSSFKGFLRGIQRAVQLAEKKTRSSDHHCINRSFLKKCSQ